MQTITNNLAAYKPIYVTYDYGSQYVRATRTSRISSSQYDTSSGQVIVTLTGKADLNISVQVFAGEDSSISNIVGTVPAFTNLVMVNAGTVPVAPLFFLGPQSRTNDAGTAAAFPAFAGGTPPLSYSWVRNATNLLNNGQKITGATSASLQVAEVLGADAGTYNLIVSNVVGSITSSPAILAVWDPIIAAQPGNIANHAGTAARFSVAVMGTEPAYQWTKEGVGAVPLATNSTLDLTAVTVSDSGAYSVIISNVFGVVTSTPASLTVWEPLTIQSINVSNDEAVIQWTAIPNSNYMVQYKDGLVSADWSNLSTVTASGPLAGITNSAPAPPQRFYRVLLQ
jgi:hypothetical protein